MRLKQSLGVLLVLTVLVTSAAAGTASQLTNIGVKSDGTAPGAEEPTPAPQPVKGAKVAPAPAPAMSAHPVQIRNVSASGRKNGLNVQITASGAIAPTAMKLSAPDRVVVDVPNAI